MPEGGMRQLKRRRCCRWVFFYCHFLLILQKKVTKEKEAEKDNRPCFSPFALRPFPAPKNMERFAPFPVCPRTAGFSMLVLRRVFVFPLNCWRLLKLHITPLQGLLSLVILSPGCRRGVSHQRKKPGKGHCTSGGNKKISPAANQHATGDQGQGDQSFGANEDQTFRRNAASGPN